MTQQLNKTDSGISSFLMLCSAVPLYARYLRSQYWRESQIASYRNNRLIRTLDAASSIPFYFNRFSGIPRLEDFKSLPILKREDIPLLKQSVYSKYPCQSGEKMIGRSSGSTGMPVEFLFDSSHQRSRYAARARYLLQNGWNLLGRNAWITTIQEGSMDGQLIRSGAVVGSHFISVFTDFHKQIEWLCRLNPHHLYTLPSNLEVLLSIFESSQIRLPALRKIFTGGEYLDEVLRKNVRRILEVDISDNYGSAEAFVAWQCPEGAYHINAEHVFVEVVDNAGREVKSGETGRILITTLENKRMPLIRYEIGDYGVADEGRCSCMRQLPLLGRVLGRTIDLFSLPYGRLVSPWEIVVRLKEISEIKQFQIIQKSLSDYMIRYVSHDALTSECKKRIWQAFSVVVGSDMTLAFQCTNEIERTAAGKFKTAISEIGMRNR